MATLNIIEPAFAQQQTAVFEADLLRARPVSHAQWLARPWRERAGAFFASLIGAQL